MGAPGRRARPRGAAARRGPGPGRRQRLLRVPPRGFFAPHLHPAAPLLRIPPRRFFTPARGTGGSGLALHIVLHPVTELLGGTIHLDPAPERGARFNVRFPPEAGA
ncbi:ATP-binding protein [Nannocystis bainbridge]|uniref:ATP-binding protein n=1 Tax=Nannocystis bainbridge TaxID=2995303 RepID=UPI00358DA634